MPSIARIHGGLRILLILLILSHSCIFVKSIEEDRDLYLVLLEGDSLVIPRRPLANRTLQGMQLQLRASLHDRMLESNLESDSYRKIYSYHHAFNGFAVHTTAIQAKRLELVEGVTLVEKDRGVRMMTSYTPDFLGLRDQVWPMVGGPRNAGEGLVIGFVDTGIDPTHPSFAYEPPEPNHTTGPRLDFFGHCYVGPTFPLGSCNGKIVSATHFYAGAAITKGVPQAESLSPFDNLGHGTHVASIAAGNHGVPIVMNGFNYGYASGMAPGARIAVYKALYKDGGTLADVVAAIDQAIRDGVDVLSLSIGPDKPPPEVPVFLSMFQMALLQARRAGVFVAQAAGNKGPESSTVLAFSPWSVAVAASSTDREYISTLVLGNNTRLRGVGLSAPTLGDGLIRFRLVAAKDAALANLSIPSTIAEECQDPRTLQPDVVRGSIVICNFSYGFLRGSSSLTAILNTAKELGFRGFVFTANPAIGEFIVQPLPLPIPAILIPSIDDVKLLMEYYETLTRRDPVSGSVTGYYATAAIKDGRVATYGGSPTVALFSSRGPDILDQLRSPADVLKPDILAPGEEIWGAWSPPSAEQPILRGYNFVLLSGTSAATPHIAGIAAIIKQQRPSWNPSMIASAMSTTASKHDRLGRPILSSGFELHSVKPSTPFDYGSGLVNTPEALDPGLVFSSVYEDYVAFLCSIPGINKLTVRNLTGIPCENNSPRVPADLNLPSVTVSALDGSLQLNRQVINVAAQPETYTASILPPKGVKVGIQPSWFTIMPNSMQNMEITLETTNEAPREFVFGEVVLTGNLNHVVRLPLSVLPVG